MQTLLEVLNKTIAYFEIKKVESPKLSAEHLFAHVLGCKRLDLYLRFEEALSEQVLQELRQAVKRRADHEPLQYIIGYVEFANCKIKTDKRALIPRPETEELVGILLEKYTKNTPKRILDLGTGTGAIAIALAQALPGVQVVAVDSSSVALKLATENINYNQVADSITLVHSDWFENVQGTFDWIISNPPYLTEIEYLDSAQQVQLHEPRNALTPNTDGLDAIKNILSAFYNYLNPDGLLALETGVCQHDSIEELLKPFDLKSTLSLEDFNNKKRFFFRRKINIYLFIFSYSFLTLLKEAFINCFHLMCC